MATLSALSVSPTTVPVGGFADITVTFETTKGGTYQVKLYEDGVEKASGDVTFEGEQTPMVLMGNINQGWELRVTGGTLVSNGTNKFRLSA